jgi:hypothetical protein
MKNWTESKTIVFNILLFIVAIVPMIDSELLILIGVKDPLMYYKILVIIAAIANKILRTITNEPIRRIIGGSSKPVSKDEK